MEGFPYTLQEAKLFGLANIVSGKKYLALNKKGTIIVPHNDSVAIAKEAIKLFNDWDYKVKVWNERKKSLDEYTIEKIINIWNDVLFSLLNGKINKLMEKQFYNETESYNILYEEMQNIYQISPKLYFKYCSITYKQIFNGNLIFFNNSFILPEEKGQYFSVLMILLIISKIRNSNLFQK